MQIYFKTMRIAKKLYFFMFLLFFDKEEFVGCFMHFIIAFNMCLLVIESGLLLFF